MYRILLFFGISLSYLLYGSLVLAADALHFKNGNVIASILLVNGRKNGKEEMFSHWVVFVQKYADGNRKIGIWFDVAMGSGCNGSLQTTKYYNLDEHYNFITVKEIIYVVSFHNSLNQLTENTVRRQSPKHK